MTFAILTNTGRNKEAAAMADGTARTITERGCDAHQAPKFP
jgi:hypothetical protein